MTLLESYHSLCEAYDYQFSLWQDGAQDFLAPERVAVNRLLQQMEAYLHSSDVPLSFRAQLLSLYSRNPKQVLEGIKDFFQIQSFREGIQYYVLNTLSCSGLCLSSCGRTAKWSLAF